MKQKWKIELEKGNVWRAKEILRSYIGSIYDPEIYFEYGKILYDVKDYYEAGKYLFVSGADREGKYKDAIDVFLNREQNADKRQFLSKLPRKFMHEDYEKYPQNVREYLENRTITKKDIDTFKKENRYTQEELSTFAQRLLTASLLFALVSLIVGIVVIIKWLIGLLI